jgi:uncharacterized membrane protein YfcA
MELFGYLASALIGISLGLIGGGGSILTVPVLVYLFQLPPTQATAYSLFIVGSTALVGSLDYMRKGLVDFRAALWFAPPSLVGVYAVRRFAVPALPEVLFRVGSYEVTRDKGILLLFALLMLGTALSMIRSRSEPEMQRRTENLNIPVIAIEGLVVGALTGLVGAGGGFLVIPALVLLAGLPMKQAIGTSLLIIAAKSLLGFVGDVQTSHDIDWAFILAISAISVMGIFAGSFLNSKVSGASLKPAFGILVLGMGLYMIASETIF